MADSVIGNGWMGTKGERMHVPAPRCYPVHPPAISQHGPGPWIAVLDAHVFVGSNSNCQMNSEEEMKRGSA